MNKRSPQHSNRFLAIASLALTLSTWSVSAQYRSSYEYSDPQKVVRTEKPITDYFESVDDKSFYQQQRIHGMKGEINDYSKRLNNLQNRFDEIFYGLTSKKSFSTPFDLSEEPQRPDPKSWLEENQETLFLEEGSPVTPSTRVNEPVAEKSNQLAFQVEAPGRFTEENGRTKALFDPKALNGRSSGRYLIISPAISFVSKIHRPNHALPKTRYKRYDPGFALNLAGGWEKNGFKYGLGGLFKTNRHHKSSWERNLFVSPDKHYFRKSSQTFAGYFDLGYEVGFTESLSGYLGAGLGYYLSLVEDPRERKDHGFFATGALGLSWRVSELIALRLGYRYLHEEEVPAHLVDLGLGFQF